MWIVAQILVSRAVARDRAARRTAAPVGSSSLFPLRDDELRLGLGGDLVEHLVAAGMGRPLNRARVGGGEYVLILSPAAEGYVLTVAAARPAHVEALFRLLREEVGPSVGSEREARLRAIARCLGEPPDAVRRSVLASLARGGDLARIERAVGALPPGGTFETRERERLVDLEAAVLAVADLVRLGGAGPAFPEIARFAPVATARDEGIEEVREGRDPQSGRPVEIVILPAAGSRSRMAVASFFRGAVASYRLDHRAAVSTLALGFDRAGDRLFYVREAFPDAAPAAPGRIGIRAFRELAAALAVLHDRNLVHGDLGPAKVLVDAAGAARLTGFGRAETGRGGRFGEDVRALAGLFLGDGGPADDLPETLRLAILRARSPDPAERPADAREFLRSLS